MATTTTTTAPDPEVFSFSGLPPLRIQQPSPLPRGFISYENSAVAITVAGAGEDQVWRINCVLPIGYAYILVDAHISMQGAIADLAGWDTVMNAELNFDTPVRAIQFDGVSQGDTFSTTTIDRRVFTFPDLPQAIIPVNDIVSQVGFRVGNHTTDDAAMTGSVFVRLMQYDIEQAHYYALHTRQLIR